MPIFIWNFVFNQICFWLHGTTLFIYLFFYSSSETDAGIAKNEIEANNSRAHTGEGVERVGRPVGTSGTITAALAHAGHTLEGAEVELVLNPLRLAIETKNLKVLEPALDCLHVCTCFVV